MQHVPENSRSSAALAETAHATGRVAVLLLFTGLFAAVWNGDGQSAATMRLAHRVPHVTVVQREVADRQQRQSTILSAARQSTAIGATTLQRPLWNGVGEMIARSHASSAPAIPFVGSPALLRGTVRMQESATVLNADAGNDLTR